MMFWQKRPDDRVSTLTAVPELAGLGPAELHRIGAQFDEVEVPAGTVLARPARPVAELLVVAAGCLQVTEPGGTYTLGPGASWGWPEMAERVVGEARIVAATEARLLVMGRSQFRALAGRWHPSPAAELERDRQAS